MGACSFVARVGSLLGILMVDSGLVYGNPVTLSFAALLSVFSGLSAVLLLPEMSSQALSRNKGAER